MMKPGRLPLNRLSNLVRITSAIGSDVSIRVGGATSDTATTNAPDDQIAGLAGFVRQVATRSPLIEGLNFSRDAPAMDISDARRLSSALGAQVVYQIGNEPDLYHIPYATYQSQWRSLHDAVAAAVPHAAFEGPDIALGLEWGDDFMNGLGSEIVALTHHAYGQGARDGGVQDIVEALAKPTIERLAQGYPAIVQRSGRRMAVRMTESGNISGSGNGVAANTLGAAIWNLREMILLAESGWAGVNFHGDVYGTTAGGYLPIVNDGANNFRPQATYYAMWLFSRLQGMRVLPVTSTLPAGQGRALAVLGRDGLMRMLVINMSVSQTLAVNLQGPASAASAQVLSMTGASAMAAAITIGGQPIPLNAAGFNPAGTPMAASRGAVPLSLPPTSAALVTFH